MLEELATCYFCRIAIISLIQLSKLCFHKAYV
jgi:hypothetical protein